MKVKKMWRRWTAGFLVLTIFCSSVSMETRAEEGEARTVEMAEEMTESSEEEKYVINKDDIVEEEMSEDSTTYDTGNGTLVTEFYGQAVRFQDETGVWVDFDASLKEIQSAESRLGTSLSAYVFENQSGNKKQYFPERLTEETPLLLEYEQYQMRFTPREENPLEVETELETKLVRNIYEEESLQPIKAVYTDGNEKKSYQYTSLNNGVKEEIVLEEVPESNQFSFLLEIPGLSIRKNHSDTGLTIYDGARIVAGIMAPNMNDATEEAYSEELSFSVETLDEELGEYVLTLTLDEEYLNANERIYPVTVDPTFTWADNSQLSDVYVLSKYPSYNYYDAGATSFYVGYGNQGISRGYFAVADLSAISKKYIKRASLSLCEAGNSLSGKTVRIYRITEDWNQTSLSWNNQPNFDSVPVGSFVTKGGS